MILYVRHLAWLNQIPDKADKSRYVLLKEENSPLIRMPDIPDGGLIYIEDLMDIGFGTSNGFGLQALSYSDLKDWADIKRIELEPWEADLLHALSRHYSAQYNDPKADSPFMQEEQQDRREEEFEKRFF